MHELIKHGKVFSRVIFLGPGPCLMKKRIYRAAVSQRLRNNELEDGEVINAYDLKRRRTTNVETIHLWIEVLRL